jgi:hypothetical protein
VIIMDEKQKKWVKNSAAAIAAALLAGMLAYINRNECRINYSANRQAAAAVEQKEQQEEYNEDYQQSRGSSPAAEIETTCGFTSQEGLAGIVKKESVAAKEKRLGETRNKHNPCAAGDKIGYIGGNPVDAKEIFPTGEKQPYVEKINAGHITRKGVEQYPRIGHDGNLYIETICNEAYGHKDSIIQVNQEPKAIEDNQLLFEYLRIYTICGEPAGKENGLGRVDKNGMLVLEDRLVDKVVVFYETSDEDNGGLKKVKKMVLAGNRQRIDVKRGSDGESDFTIEDELEARSVTEGYYHGTTFR